jgi:broad specificity phosphatase PhoE
MIEIAARMVNALEEMDRRHRDGIVAVVSHGDPIRSALCVYLGLPLDFVDRLEILPASISVLELNDQGARLRCCNLTAGGMGDLVGGPETGGRDLSSL